MRRVLGALAGTVVGVYLLATYKVTPEPEPVQGAVPTAPARTTPTRTAPPTVAPRTAPPLGVRPAPFSTTPSPTQAVVPTVGDAYTGAVARTAWGDVQVEIVVAGGKVVDVRPLVLPSSRSRSAFISQVSFPILRAEAIQAQSARVNVVSGATYTSDGYSRSLDSALKQAHLG